MNKIISAFLCILMLAALAASSVAAAPVSISDAAAYTDLDADWYRDAAQTYGYPEIFGENGLFMPSRTITRMEFVRMLHRALGISINYFAATDIAEYFTDVVNGDNGAGELYDLVTAGVIDAGGEFNPDGPLTREVMINWTIAALDYVTGGNYAMILIMPAPFDDDAQIAEEYKNDVTKSVILGLIKGRGDNMLYPKSGATRAEAVAVADRLVKLIHSLTDSAGVNVSASAREAGGAFEMALVIENNTGETVSIEHTSGQKYDFVIYGADGDTLYTWSADKAFIALVNTTELEPGGRLEFSETLDAETYAGIKDRLVSVKAFIVGTSADFDIANDGYEAKLN